MSTYQKLANLKVEIDSYELEPLKQEIPGGIVRHTTVIHFKGQDLEGVGEDVTYEPIDQLAFQKHGSKLKFSGRYTLDNFSEALSKKKLFHKPPGHKAFRYYRRWAFES